MPDVTTLGLFALAAVVLVAVPGPNLIYIVTRSLAEGRRAGLVSTLGVETGTLVHVAAATVGVSALLAASAVAFGVVKYLGAAYLVLLGLRALLRRDPPAGAPTPDPAPMSQVYRQGLLVQLLNPRSRCSFSRSYRSSWIRPAGRFRRRS